MNDPTKDCTLGRCPFSCEGYVHVCPYAAAAARGEGLTSNASSSDLDADEIRIKDGAEDDRPECWDCESCANPDCGCLGCGVARGECEHRFVMHYADKAGQCDKCGAIDTEVWHEGGILEQMYDEASKEEQ